MLVAGGNDPPPREGASQARGQAGTNRAGAGSWQAARQVQAAKWLGVGQIAPTMQQVASPLATNPNGASGPRRFRHSQFHARPQAFLGNEGFDPVTNDHGNDREGCAEIRLGIA